MERGGVNQFADMGDTAQTHQKPVLKKEATVAVKEEKSVEGNTSDPTSKDSARELEDYGAQLRRERREDAQHYLKSYRDQIRVCWGALALAAICVFIVSVGIGMLLALPPLIYLWSLYSTAYSPGHMGLSRGQTFRVVFLGIPLVLFYILIAGGLI